MRAEKNIEIRNNKYVLYMYDGYKGTYNTLEEARKQRESIRCTHEKINKRRVASLEGFTERLNQAIWDSDKDITLICKQSQISRTNLYDYRNGILPKIDNLARLALTLNVSADWLLGIKK